MIDCHVHLRDIHGIGQLERVCAEIGAHRMNVVCTFDRKTVNANPSAFVAKEKCPGRFFVFAGLDHSRYFSDGKLSPPSLDEQVERLLAIGADGIKMLENKPTHRKLLDVPIDSEYFEAYFSLMETLGLPILWHVADPEEFWDESQVPKWAKERGWSYDETFVRKEKLYSEVQSVLERHPGLNIIFAHFYFMSADLPGLARLFDEFPKVHVDLAPGIELLYNISRDVDTGRDFFITYADRILFGTDISSQQTLEESKIRAGLVVNWLETDDEFRVPEGADFLLGEPEEGVIRGLALPKDVTWRICHANFERLVGSAPRPLNAALAAEECMRLAQEVSWLNGCDAEQTEAFKAAMVLSSRGT